MQRVNLDTKPGEYRVSTANGAVYLITIIQGRPARLRRGNPRAIDFCLTQADLTRDEDIELSSFSFTLGWPGTLMLWDEAARGHPGYGKICVPGAGAVRRTTRVTQIEAISDG